MTVTGPPSASAERRDALVEQLFHASTGALELMHVYLGDRLGLYAALAQVDDVSPAELARGAGISERYAREWLEQQAVAGMLDVASDDGDGQSRRYRLPPGAADVLCTADSLYLLAPLGAMVAGIGQALPQVVQAFRSGGGVPYAAYGAEIRDGIARLNRPMFVNQLATEWIPAMPDIDARLRREDPPGRVADLGCGSGWSAIALARGYPAARVDGIDSDEASIEDAKRNVAAAAVADRVTLTVRDAADAGTEAGADVRYDLVTLFETLHDMAHPVAALRTARDLLAPGGAVLVADERVGEAFTAPGDELERFNYGWSALHCLAAALVEPDSAGTGTVIRPDTVRRYAHEAGFREVTVLPIEHDFWRFYRLDV
jgi:2-polyprenyl-3-methyl-5-hydroxy-6-metoxy-1,4-benzoquinol methylase